MTEARRLYRYMELFKERRRFQEHVAPRPGNLAGDLQA